MDDRQTEPVEVSLSKWNTVRIRKGKFFIDFHLADVASVKQQLEMLEIQLNNLLNLPAELAEKNRQVEKVDIDNLPLW